MSPEGTNKAREMTIPADALPMLRTSLRNEAGALGATHALHAAGFAAGSSVMELLGDRLPNDAATAGEGDFWRALSDFFIDRGWGSLRHERVHSGLGVLASSDWAEARDDGGDQQPSCAFGAGVLSFILSDVAQDPVAVLEVACRSRGDGECRFAFGSAAAIHELYGLLLEDHSFDEALAAL